MISHELNTSHKQPSKPLRAITACSDNQEPDNITWNYFSRKQNYQNLQPLHRALAKRTQNVQRVIAHWTPERYSDQETLRIDTNHNEKRSNCLKYGLEEHGVGLSATEWEFWGLRLGRAVECKRGVFNGVWALGCGFWVWIKGFEHWDGVFEYG